MNSRLVAAVTATALAITVDASGASAATYVAAGSPTAEGTASSSIPLGNGGVSSVTSQFLFGSSQLGGLTAGSVITALGFRINVNSPAPAGALNYSSYQISLGGSTQAVGSLTTNFAANQAANTMTVRSGALTIPVGSLISQPFQANTPQIPNPFFSINFTTPYTYTGGDLLLSLSYVTSNTTNTTVDGTPLAAGGLDSVSNIGANGTLTSAHLYGVPVVQFTTLAATAAVPEPATWAMMMLGFGAMGFAMRRKKVATRIRFA